MPYSIKLFLEIQLFNLRITFYKKEQNYRKNGQDTLMENWEKEKNIHIELKQGIVVAAVQWLPLKYIHSW